jgi:hypothetical protein
VGKRVAQPRTVSHRFRRPRASLLRKGHHYVLSAKNCGGNVAYLAKSVAERVI